MLILSSCKRRNPWSFFFFKQKPAYEMRISDWSSDVCSSDLHVFLWCRDRRIYGPSRKELERVVRSQRQDYLDTWLIGASDRLSSDAVALLEASLADPDSSTGFNRMKGDAGQATLDNILDVTEKLAFIQRLD